MLASSKQELAITMTSTSSQPDGGFRVETQGETSQGDQTFNSFLKLLSAPLMVAMRPLRHTMAQLMPRMVTRSDGRHIDHQRKRLGYVGLPKAVNGAELANPADAPDSITYNVYPQEDGSVLVSVEAGAGVWWNYKLVKTAEAAEASVLAGTWYMSLADGSLGVGPSEFDVSWWANDAAVTDGRACYFDDSYVFGCIRLIDSANVQDGETRLG